MFFLGLLLLALALVSFALLRTYGLVPAREIKRQARQGDTPAQMVYRAVAFGASLRALLKTVLFVSGVLALACLSSALGFWWAVIVIFVVWVVVVYVFVPSSELTHTSLWLAQRAAPPLAWTLERLQPVLGFGVRFVQKHRPVTVHTGLYQKSDLVDLLEQQKHQPDSRISDGELELLKHALSFGDKLVSESLTPKRTVKSVGVHEQIGPVLMDELNKSGHSRFPVYDGSTDNVVGILYLHDLVANKHGGKVADVMNTKLSYVHEDFTLYQTLQAFLKTKRHLFLVVNSFEELVGIITVEDVVEQMIGKQIVDEFDHYDDLREVATAAAKKEHIERHEPVAAASKEVSTTTDATEVVK